jgi:acetyl esterase/lipase
VPFGYLTSTTLMAVLIFFAVAPPRPGQSSPSNPGYWLGFLVNELPFIAFYWLLASTVLAAAQGDLTTPVGLIALAIAVLASGGLVVILRRGLRAGPTVESALRGAEPTARLSRRLPVAPLLFAPFSVRTRSVERIANLEYGDAGRWNLLDVYRHRAHPSDCPVLIHLHGGAFRRGRKSNEARLLLYRLASHGWVCISANYRLGSSVRYPDQLIDAKKVIAWIREHGNEHGAGSEIVVAGSSAGANLAATLALTPNEPHLQPEFERVDTSVAAAVCLYGYYGSYGGDSSLSSPLAHIHADAPPFFVAHGDRDTLVLVEDARAFVEVLRSVSTSCVVYAELPGAQHTFDLFRSPRFERVVEGIEVFATGALPGGSGPG